MHAIILAAGCGRRMHPLTKSAHKGLLPIGDTTPLDRIVDELAAAGVDVITVVVGHRAADVEAHLRDGHPDVEFRFVANDRYATTNNIVSLRLALADAPTGEEVVLIECDLLLAPGTLSALCSGDSRSVALVDGFRIGMDGTVVTVDSGLITGIHPPAWQDADFSYSGTYKTLNVYRFDQVMVDEVWRPLIASADDDQEYYEAMLARVPDLAAIGLRAEVVPAGSWIEIDDPVDLASARFAFAPQERAAILEKTHGGHWSFDVLDFSFMVNQRFPTPAIHAAMRHALAGLVGSYGSAQDVVDEKLSWLLGCEPAHLVTLAGASQVYPLLRRQWADARVAIPAPTFGEYARTFPDATTYADEPGAPLPDLDAVAAAHDLVVVVNPNNPTGTTTGAAGLHALAERNPDTIFLVDESFSGFTGQRPLRVLLEDQPLANVLVVASLGKVLGVSGMRIGYVYGHDRTMLDAIADELPIWSLGSQAEHLIELTLKSRTELELSLAQTREDRAVFADELGRIEGVRMVYPSGGNFVLVELDGTEARSAAELREALLIHASIAVKDVSQRFADRRPRIRVGVRLPADNEKLLTALRRQIEAGVITSGTR